MATLNAVIKGIKAEFANALMGGDVDAYNDFYTVVNSNSNNEIYYFADVVPGVKELLDEVNLGEYKDYDYTIVNKEYYDGLIEIRTTIEDSESSMPGLLKSKAIGLASEFRDHPEVLLNTLISGATSAVAFDGTAYISTSRPNLKQGKADYNNRVSSTGIASSADAEIVMTSLINRANAMKDANGRPFNKNVKNWIVLHPTAQIDYWRKLANAEFITNGVTNTRKGQFKTVTNYESTDGRVMLINGDKSDQFIVQNRKAPEWFVEDDNKKKYVDFYFKARQGAGYGNPLHGVMATTS